jgi:hypothetical protein
MKLRVLSLVALGAGLAAAAPARAQAGIEPADSAKLPPLARPLPAALTPVAAGDTTGRPRAVDVGSAYDVRFRVHRWGSYVMVPLFAAQYVLGSRLLGQREDAFNGERVGVDEGLRDAHRYTAYGVGALFAVNTVTGVWNWWDSRHVEDNRKLRAVHALSMIAADAGFVATGIAGSRAVDRNLDDARNHRALALTSMGVSAASALMMVIFNRQ